jgi:hypothetical protein
MHTNIHNEKKYIGITKDVRTRWKNNGSEYLKKHPDGTYCQPVFAYAINKYPDWENDWKHEVLHDGLTKAEASQLEIELIALHKTNCCKYKNPAFGYNMTDGGDGAIGKPMSDEQKKKLSEANKGKIVTEETRKKISKIHKGKKITNEHKQKLSEANKGENNPNYGVSPRERMDEETYEQWRVHIKENHPRGDTHYWSGVPLKERMSEEVYENWLYKQQTRDRSGSNNPMYGVSPQERMDEETYKQWLHNLRANIPRGSNHPMYGRCGINSTTFRPVYCIELNEIFWGTTDVQNKYNIPAPNVINCCMGKAKSAEKHPTTKDKLHWLYVNDKVNKDGSIINGAITLGYVTEIQLNNYLNNEH